MNNDKYRVYLTTTHGNFLIAAGTSVNTLLATMKQWLKTKGLRLMDEEVQSLELQTLDKNGGLVASEKAPLEKVSQITSKAVQLGAR